ncbi:MAG TPA: hypothetical protein VK668_17250 [Mucilaginibacter sp.]|nr:hypothetical protein [Mucilaginibacter sp.]
MKPLIRYISPLLIGGLMLTFYYHTPYNKDAVVKVDSCLIKTQQAKPVAACNIPENSFSFFRDVIAKILPVLKSLN